MVEFFNTQMGHKFIQGTMPRIAESLETIAANLEAQKSLDEDTNNKVIAITLAGLYTDGAHHKQFCLYEIAKLLNLDVESQVTEGKLDPGRPA